MPELPEVETIVNQLKRNILNKEIIKVMIFDKNIVDLNVNKIIGKKILNVWRRAKLIIIELNNDRFLLIHLRMTGHFHYVKEDKNLENSIKEYEKFIVLKIFFNDNSLLTHNSIRKFGYVKFINKKMLKEELDKLGVEPLSKEFNLDQFKKIVTDHQKSNIKVLLMNQNLIAGIGNIYAQEILYKAKVSPLRKNEELKEDEIKRIFNFIKEILTKALKNNGSTTSNYVHIEGSGGYQKYLEVYHKLRCPKKHTLKSQSIGGRNTYYCPICQR